MSLQDPDSCQASGEVDFIHDYIELKPMEDVKTLDETQLYSYIEKLHGIIRKYDTKITSYKRKLTYLLTKESNSLEEAEGAHTLNNETKESNEEVRTNEKKQYSATDAFNFVDEMLQAAKQAENISNMVYEPTSGLYYDPKTGYYYNAEYGLYYDGNTGCYYSYDQAKESYEFHSRVQVQTNSSAAPVDPLSEIDVEFDENGGVITDVKKLQKIKAEKEKAKEFSAIYKRNSKKKHKKNRKKHRKRKSKKEARHCESNDGSSEISYKGACQAHDVEDGELSQSSTTSTSDPTDDDSSQSDNSVPVFKAVGQFQDIAKKYPPSLRIIVQETNVQKLTVGSLHLITFKGGSLGREGAHDVIIPDVNVSKCHLDFHYDAKQGIYKCRDLGSRNGTVINGVRISESEMQDLVHGSVITLGQTKLLCHIHKGNSTCGLCEPGLLIESSSTTTSLSATNSNVLSHKEQLKKLQKRYGLENEKFLDSKSNFNPKYKDRSAQRRIQIGSSHDVEKTEVACVDTEIASSNKGFKMLSKLGWQKGDTLGKGSEGLLSPIKVVGNEGTSGLGSSESVTVSASRLINKRKMANLKITQKRYQRANDKFLTSGESE